MKTNLIALFILLSSTGISQFASPEEVNIPREEPTENSSPFLPIRNATIGDIDGDGIDDAIMAPFSDEGNYDYLLVRKGIPVPPYFYLGADTLFDKNYNPSLNDFDQDGDLDLLVVDFKRDPEDVGVLAISLNDGAGNFGTLSPLPNEGGAGARQFITSDIDQDGDMDILYTVYNSASTEFENGIVWLENDGTGSFDVRILSTIGGYALAAADIDADGDKDLLISDLEANEIIFFENVNNDLFSLWFTRSAITFPSVLKAGDFNGDGLDDYTCAATDITHFISYYQNEGGAEPTFAETVINNSPSYPPSSNILTPDFDGDGDLDVVWTSIFAGSAGWYENDGNGNFTERNFFQKLQGRTRILIENDFNGDGLPDFLSISNGFFRTAVTINNGNENLNFLLLDQEVAYEDALLGSLIKADNDPRDEILLLTRSAFYIVGDQNQGFGNLPAYDSPNYSGIVQGDATDVDSDGDDDVILATNNGIFLYIKDSGGFTEVDLPGNEVFGYFELHDFNEDGIEDIVAINYGSSNLKILYSDGIGSFEPPVTLTDQCESAKRFTILNAHGTAPGGIVFPQNLSNNLAFLPFLGDGNFGSVEVINHLPINVSLIESGNLNGDDSPDLVLGSKQGIVAVYNNGNNQFGNPLVVDLIKSATQVLIGDYTGDGANDILILRKAGSTSQIAFFKNFSNGASFFQIQNLTGLDIESILTGNFNNDGRPDLAFDIGTPSNFVDDRLALSYNNSSGFSELFDTSGDANKSENGDLSIFPNPVINSFRFADEAAFSDEMLELAIYDVQGKLVDLISNVHASQEINVAHLQQGNYQVIVTESVSRNRHQLRFTKQ